VAIILKFPELHREPDMVRPATDGASAQILFFTGVRYERMEKAQRRKVKLEPPELPLAL
jgi:hypothetical protein